MGLPLSYGKILLFVPLAGDQEHPFQLSQFDHLVKMWKKLWHILTNKQY